MPIPRKPKKDLLGGSGTVQLVLIQHLARGSFGSVARCEMRRSGGDWMPVAVKTAVCSVDSKAAEALDKECKILQACYGSGISVELRAFYVLKTPL